MDGITHLFVGRLLAALFPDAPSLGWLVTVFAVLPDLDTVTWFVPRLRRFLHHRGITHTLPFGIAAALLAAAIVSVAGGAAFLPAFAAAMLGFLSHVALDVLNWGAPVLWPVRKRPVEWTVHGGFAWTAGLSAAGLLVLLVAGPFAAVVSAVFGFLFLSYLALRAGLKLLASRRHPGARLIPTGNPFVWRVVADAA